VRINGGARLSRNAAEVTAEHERVEALRRGDEGAFAALFDELQPALRRLIRHYLESPAVIDEVLQETWLGVIRGIFAFEGRSSLKTWIFRILINRARTHAVREKRSVPFADLGADEPESSEAIDPADRTLADSRLTPERSLLEGELQRELAAAIAALPPKLRLILTLRDVEGLSSVDVCNALGIRETNQRVLLHRARSKVRAALGPYLRASRGVS